MLRLQKITLIHMVHAVIFGFDFIHSQMFN